MEHAMLAPAQESSKEALHVLTKTDPDWGRRGGGRTRNQTKQWIEENSISVLAF